MFPKLHEIERIWTPRKGANVICTRIQGLIRMRHQRGRIQISLLAKFGLKPGRSGQKILSNHLLFLFGIYNEMSNWMTKKFVSTRMGFEPTRGDPIGLAVQRLNHSATSSCGDIGDFSKVITWSHLLAIYCMYVLCALWIFS